MQRKATKTADMLRKNLEKRKQQQKAWEKLRGGKNASAEPETPDEANDTAEENGARNG